MEFGIVLLVLSWIVLGAEFVGIFLLERTPIKIPWSFCINLAMAAATIGGIGVILILINAAISFLQFIF